MAFFFVAIPNTDWRRAAPPLRVPGQGTTKNQALLELQKITHTSEG